MNERIKELEKLSVYYNEEEETWEFDRNKFAELIINECCLMCLHNEDMDRIENHFGVE